MHRLLGKALGAANDLNPWVLGVGKQESPATVGVPPPTGVRLWHGCRVGIPIPVLFPISRLIPWPDIRSCAPVTAPKSDYTT